MRIRSGVVTYERWKIPLGQFTLETEGTVDLVSQQMDVVTYIPFAALSDTAAGALTLGVGGVIHRLLPGAIAALTMIPFRTRGPLGNVSTSVDPGMLAKHLGRSLDPTKIIREGLRDLFDLKAPRPR
jgi:hypothetical protein